MDYQQAIDSLREYVEQNELERRLWAGEKWGHVGGRVYKICRVLCPILSVISVISAIFYDMIRYFQLELSAQNGLSYDVEESVAYMYIVTAFCVLTVAANVLTFTKFKNLGFAFVGGLNLLMAIYLFTQINISMPNGNYKTLIAIIIAVQFVLAIACAIILVITYRDNRDNKSALENTLHKITAERGGLTEEGEYAELIEQYLKEQSEKSNEQKQKKFKKEAK